MDAALTLGGYVFICLMILVVAARWLIKHDPAMRDDAPLSQDTRSSPDAGWHPEE